MKIVKYVRQFTLFIFTSICLYPSLAFAKETISIVLDELGEHIQVVGKNRSVFSEEFINLLFEEESFDIEFIRSFRQRAKQLIQNDNATCVALVHDTDSRLIYAELPWAFHEMKVYVKKGIELQFDAPHYLGDLKIGIFADYSYDEGGLIDQQIANPNLSNSFNIIYGERAFSRILGMLKKDRLDGVVSCPIWLATASLTEQFDMSQLVEGYNSGISKGLYFGCSKDNELSQKLIHIVNRRIKQLAKTGELNHLFNKYNMDTSHFDHIFTR